jgi:hypothetical protein
MHEHHEDITKVDLMLTEPSQVIEAGPGEGEQQRLAPLWKPRRGQVCFDLSCVPYLGQFSINLLLLNREMMKQPFT